MSGRRLFFALWPDDETRQQLHHWQTHNLSGDVRWQHRADLHMTLHFLGQVAAEPFEALVRLGGAIRIPAFTLVLDEIGHWPRPRVLWAGPGSVPGELIDLHEQLGAGLQRAGFELDKRSYQAHVTLARKVPASPTVRPLKPVVWSVRELALVESRPGADPMYEPLRRWRLE